MWKTYNLSSLSCLIILNPSFLARSHNLTPLSQACYAMRLAHRIHLPQPCVGMVQLSTLARLASLLSSHAEGPAGRQGGSSPVDRLLTGYSGI